MTEKDVIFKFYQAEECPDPNSFCHYGWEGNGAFSFWKYACAYYESAVILFDKFKASKGDYALLDGLGLTICFLYRHFVELSVKWLFVKFVVQDEIHFKNFLNKGHNLYELWKETKPKLKELRKRVGSSISIGCLEHYILEFDKFDKNEEAMRYPVKKDSPRMHSPSRLDVVILHDRMIELFNAFERFADDIDNQLFAEVQKDKLALFEKEYEKMRQKIISAISKMKTCLVGKVDKTKKRGVFCLIELLKKADSSLEYLRECNDDELIMLDTLFYTGRMINCEELRLSKNPHVAKIDVFKMCVINMMHDHLEFGKELNGEINFLSKSAESIYLNVKKAVSVLEWDNPEILKSM